MREHPDSGPRTLGRYRSVFVRRTWEGVAYMLGLGKRRNTAAA
jgi:hypothetical protein